VAQNKLAWTFGITTAALFMTALDNLVVVTALPVIQKELGASLSGLEWTVNAYTLTFAALLLTGAALGDRFGRRRMFTIGLAVFTTASALAALAPGSGALIAARALQGAGAAIVMPLTLTILSEAFPPGRRGLVIGAWSGISGLGVALGPLVGGAIVDGISWQWIFWVNVPIGLVLLPLAITRLSETTGPDGQLDLPGLALGSTGLLGLVLGLVRGQSLGWTSAPVLAALGTGVILLAGFVAWELRAPAPMLPLRFFRNRAFAAANGVSLAMSFGIFGAIFLLSQFFQTAQGYSALESGLRTLPWTGMPMIVAPIAGALSDRLGSRPLMAAGLALQSAAMVWIALVTSPTVAYGALVPAFVMAGGGMALVFAPSANAVLNSVHPREAGKASGATSTVRELGGVLGIAVLASVFAGSGGYGSPQDFADGLVPALWVAAGVLAVGALTALAVPGLRRGAPVVAAAAAGSEPAVELASAA